MALKQRQHTTNTDKNKMREKVNSSHNDRRKKQKLMEKKKT